jgi:PAS domain S-box-containing protein
VHPEDFQKCLDTYTQSFDRREKFRMEYRLRQHDGEYRWILDVGVPRFDADGSFAGYIGIGVDISERKRVEQERLLSESQFRQFFETMPEYCYMVSPSGEIVDTNLAACAALGYTKDELMGRPLTALYAPECVPKMRELFKKWKENGELRNEEMIVITKHGERRTVLLNAGSVRDSNGNILHSTSVHVDITERKRADEALQQREMELTEAQRLAGVGSWQWEPRTDTVIWSKELYRLMGIDPTLPAPSYKEHAHLFAAESWERLQRAVQGALQTGTSYALDLEVVRPESIAKWEIARGEPVRDKSGQIIGLRGTVQDITERKQAEESLRESEDKLRLLLDSTAEAIYGIDLEHRCTFCNSAFLRALGYERIDEVLGKNTHDLIHHSHADGTSFPAEECRVHRVLRTGEGDHAEDEVLWRANGTSFPAEYWSYPQRRGQELVGAVVAFIDITERRRAEEAVKESETRFRLVADTAPVMIWMSGLDKKPTYFNQLWLDFTGLSETDLRYGLAGITHPEDYPKCHDIYCRAFDQRQPFRKECRLRRHDGQYRWMLDNGVPRFHKDGSFAGYIGSCIDVTDHKLGEESLAEMSRKLLEAQEKERARIGRELHDDINQRLAMLAVELEQLQDNPSEVRSRVQELRQQTAELSNDVQALSHELHSSKLEYLGAIGGMKSWCKEFGERQGIQIEFKSTDVQTSVAPEVGLCLFRVLQEALHNAVKHSGVKRIEVQLRQDSGEIHLVISDLGRGFDLETATQGRGLGLTSMQERVRLVNGIFEIQSKPMGGTTIHVRVPLSWGGDSMRAAG